MQGQGQTSGPLGPINVKNHINRLFNLEYTLGPLRTYWPHIDGHALPRGIKHLVSVEQARDAGLSLAGEQLQERR